MPFFICPRSIFGGCDYEVLVLNYKFLWRGGRRRNDRTCFVHSFALLRIVLHRDHKIVFQAETGFRDLGSRFQCCLRVVIGRLFAPPNTSLLQDFNPFLPVKWDSPLTHVFRHVSKFNEALQSSMIRKNNSTASRLFIIIFSFFFCN